MLKKAIFCFAFFLIIGICGSACHAQTVNAASCNASDVQKALNSVNQATAVVVIPSGTCPWTSAISYTVPSVVSSLTIQGQTTVSCIGTPGTSGYSCTPADNTIIEDNVTTNTPPIWTINVGSQNVVFTMEGLTIETGTSGAPKNNGIVDFVGTSALFRMSQIDLITNYQGIEWDGQIEGVIDHSYLNCGTASTYSNCLRVYNDLLDSGPGNDDGGWAAPSDWGSSHFIYLEDSISNGGYTNDCDHAGRMVERYDTFLNINNAMENHPTKDPTGPSRGCRAQEFYHNYVGNTTQTYSAMGGQEGTWLVWGNTVASGTSLSHFWAGSTWRNDPSQPSHEESAGCGTNCSPPNGWGMCGTDIDYPGTPGSGSPWDGNSTATGYPCLDGLGRGQTQQTLNGANFPNRVNNSTGTQSWPQQDLEPMYFWMNSLPSNLTGSAEVAINSDYSTAANRDYYYDSASFNGMSGTGYGTLANRPSTCTAGPGGTYGQSPTGSYGVAYWATDANSGNGELYVCTSANTWTAIYTPYTYPHPLDGGTVTPSTSGPTSSAPAPPTGLSAIVQ